MKFFSMDAALKRRLLITIFVVILVVIFLPMVFNSKDDSQPDVSKGMPTLPPSPNVIEQKIETLNAPIDIPLTPPVATEAVQAAVPVHSSVPTPGLSNNLLMETKVGLSDHSTEDTNTVAPQLSTDISKGIPALPELPILKSHHTASSSVAPKMEKKTYSPSMRKSDATSQDVLKNVPVRLKKANMAKQAWVVQLGSFTQGKNAEGLVKRLRANHFKAFAYNDQSAGKGLTRVYVGPFVRLNEAKEIREQLMVNMHLNCIVASFHPTKMTD